MHAVGHALCFGEPCAGVAQQAGGVRFVDDEDGVVALGQFAQGGQVGHVAVHGEDRVGDDEAAGAAGFRFRVSCVGGGVLVTFEEALEFGVSQVWEGADGGAAGAGGVDEAGVVELVETDQIVRAGEAGEYGQVGHVTGGQEQGAGIGGGLVRVVFADFGVLVVLGCCGDGRRNPDLRCAQDRLGGVVCGCAGGGVGGAFGVGVFEVGEALFEGGMKIEVADDEAAGAAPVPSCLVASMAACLRRGCWLRPR